MKRTNQCESVGLGPVEIKIELAHKYTNHRKTQLIVALLLALVEREIRHTPAHTHTHIIHHLLAFLLKQE